MVVAGVVIQTVPRAAAAVSGRLTAVPGLEIRGDDGDSRIAAVWTSRTGDELEEMGEALIAEDPEILGIYPTFAAEDGASPAES